MSEGPKSNGAAKLPTLITRKTFARQLGISINTCKRHSQSDPAWPPPYEVCGRIAYSLTDCMAYVKVLAARGRVRRKPPHDPVASGKKRTRRKVTSAASRGGS